MKKSDVLALLPIGVFVAIYLSLGIVFEYVLKSVSGGFAIIICSVIAAAICAVLFPVPEEKEAEE